MKTERIEQLIEKYWLCETTLPEEEELRRFFQQEKLPGHLAQYKSWFELKQEEMKTGLDGTFDRKIMEAITKQTSRNRTFTWRTVLTMAASVAIIWGSWFSIQSYNSHQADPWKQDTCETPEQALAEVQKVLNLVSGQMERGQNMVHKQMEKANPLTDIIKK